MAARISASFDTVGKYVAFHKGRLYVVDNSGRFHYKGNGTFAQAESFAKALGLTVKVR